MITPALLRSAVGCSSSDADRYAPWLDEACARFNITGPRRLADFLAQIGHESGSLSASVERWGPTQQQLRYERSFDHPWPESRAQARLPDFARNSLAWTLGNTEPGDGLRFRGRGPMQITGRSNYRAMTHLLREAFSECPDLTVEPERLMEPRWGARAACAFWNSIEGNAYADADDFEGLTRKINGGMTGWDDRLARRRRARATFGGIADATPTSTPELKNVAAGSDPSPSPPSTPVNEWDLNNPQEATMVAPAVAAIGGELILGLAKSLFQAFSPLAQEKLAKELGRHTDRPEVAQQIASAAIDAVKIMTQKTDPVEAVLAARSNPAALAKAESSVLDELDRLAPMLERLAAIDRQAFMDEEASRAAADARALGNPNDQDRYLTTSIVRLMIGVLAGLCAVWVTLAYLKADTGPLSGAILALASLVGAKFGTRYDHRYGSSAGSQAKDAVLEHALRRKA